MQYNNNINNNNNNKIHWQLISLGVGTPQKYKAQQGGSMATL